MKHIVTLLLAVVALPVFAADVATSFEVVKDGAIIFKATSQFVGLTDDEAKKMRVRGDRILDHASKAQDKGGPYTLRFQWNAEPVVETAGLRFGAVNSTMRQAQRMGDEILRDAEKAEKAGKGKPWGK